MTNRVVGRFVAIEANNDDYQIRDVQHSIVDRVVDLAPALGEWKITQVHVEQSLDQYEPEDEVGDGEVDDEVIVVGAKAFFEAESS